MARPRRTTEFHEKLQQVNAILAELSGQLTTAERLAILDNSLYDLDEFPWASAVWEVHEQIRFYHSTSQNPVQHHRLLDDGGLCRTRKIEQWNRALGKLGKGRKQGKVDACCPTCSPHPDCEEEE